MFNVYTHTVYTRKIPSKGSDDGKKTVGTLRLLRVYFWEKLGLSKVVSLKTGPNLHNIEIVFNSAKPCFNLTKPNLSKGV